jgi:hypothetical protein
MESKRYYVRYGTGAGDKEVIGTLEEAEKEAEKGIAYTQKDVAITLDDVVVARAIWWQFQPHNSDKVLASFGKFGCYTGWYVAGDEGFY